ncbi:hypothetical protein [Pluralibacter sp.]|uniref:hypothetical protein n=1 Tax=Pluralibacter sp. TaxID=1920032 RepID=UPI0025E9872B|nr:hypothetical protein [Pluralibacter sp.]
MTMYTETPNENSIKNIIINDVSMDTYFMINNGMDVNTTDKTNEVAKKNEIFFLWRNVVSTSEYIIHPYQVKSLNKY